MFTFIQSLSPGFYARICGVLYLLMIVCGIVNEVVIRGAIIVPGNAAATFANLQLMETLWRTGIILELLIIIFTVCIGIIIYILTRNIHQELSLLALLFGLLAVGVQAASLLHLLEALFPLGNSKHFSSFTMAQLHALSTISIQTHGLGFAIGLLLFGPFFFITGYLIYHSGYLPKVLGVLYVAAGFSYFISSFMLILAPAFGAKYYFFIAVPALIGEMSFSLWLLIKGINTEQWNRVVIKVKMND